MGIFSRTEPTTVGVIMDVGSASVLVGLVASSATSPTPEIIWSHREYVPLRALPSLEQASKNVLASLMNAALQLDTVGRKILREQYTHLPAPSMLQVTIAAPWSYTITKSITYSKDEPFTINRELLSDLTDAAQRKVELEIKENELVRELGLEIMTELTTEILANGYRLRSIANQEATSIAISRTNAVTQHYLTEAINDIHDKTLPKTSVAAYSFMQAYYGVLRQRYPDLTDICLVDVTFEATEIGIVRDGVLRYCTHTPYGMHSLLRELAAIENIPLEAATSLITNTDITSPDTTHVAERATLFEQYERRLSELFLQTGDALSIPKAIMLHTAAHTERFFTERILGGAQAATKAAHNVTGITGELLTADYPDNARKQLLARHDTAMLLSAKFFHTRQEQ